MHSKLDLNNQKTPEEIVICREQLSQSHMYTVRLLFSIRVEDLKHSQNMFSCHFFKKPVGFFFSSPDLRSSLTSLWKCRYQQSPTNLLTAPQNFCVAFPLPSPMLTLSLRKDHVSLGYYHKHSFHISEHSKTPRNDMSFQCLCKSYKCIPSKKFLIKKEHWLPLTTPTKVVYGTCFSHADT